MISRQVVPLAAVALAAAISLPAALHAGAPSPTLGRNAQLAHHCKGGANKGATCDANLINVFCTTDGDCPAGTCDVKNSSCTECPGSTCDFTFVGKTHSAILTAVMDEDVTDSVDNTDKTGRALTVMLEVGKGKSKRILAETYRHPFDGDLQIGIWNQAVTEELFVAEQAGSFLFQIPPGTLAEGLRAVLGEQGIPIVASVSKNLTVSDNQGNLSCKGPADPLACCTGAGLGNCDRNGECTGPLTPHLCCTGAGTGTCNIGEIGSALRLKVKLRFVAAP